MVGTFSVLRHIAIFWNTTDCNVQPVYPVMSNTVVMRDHLSKSSYVIRCAIWYQLCNLKNVKNSYGGFSRFLNCTNDTKLRNAPHIELYK